MTSVNINWKMLTLARPANKMEEAIFTRWVLRGESCMWRLISCKVGPAGETADGKQKSREGRGNMEIKTS